METGFVFCSKSLLLMLLLALLGAATEGHRHGHGMRVGFYSNSCPQAESIIGSIVYSHIKKDLSLAAGLLRLHFHDCFVRGCDASILIDGPQTERKAGPNINLRGYEVVDDAKAQLEAACPRVVSCADILAIAARDSVHLSGGISWEVPTGRRDGRVSVGDEALTLPGPNDTVYVQKEKFQSKGLNTQDLVVLAGGHTIGTTACEFFRDRLYSAKDPSIDPELVPTLRALCPKNGNGTKRVALDKGSQFKFDASYYKNLKKGHGIFRSDQALWTDPSTKPYVQRYLGSACVFKYEFGQSMVKMGNIEVLTVLASFASHITMSFFVCVLLLALAIASAVHGQGTRVGFYSTSCPRAESIVRSTVQSHVGSDRTLAAGLLRLHFHDCFVEGCDGSVLIDGAGAEKTAGRNDGLRGFEVIDDAKTRLEAMCPGVVSCADILALAARDSVVLSGGVSWAVPTGRKDGLVSKASNADINLPGPLDSVDVQKKLFASKGLNTQDLVTLVGGHTIGTTSCGLLRSRIYNFNGNDSAADPSIDPAFLPTLRAICQRNGDVSKRVTLDNGSQTRFDTSFFANLRSRRGILQSDQVLWADPSTKAIVQKFLGVRGSLGLAFNAEFGKSMVKMSLIGVKTSANGQIRKKCSAFN
ncbi:hypothetical protein L6164_032568 [Bauhinia variegata]|uniref:Uncharacterized protein n=1 Tax=Bauhinia variegata TaxID=167791 RepID=A0ACB9KP73_BAUVA|nr:hypothetical protein L6164_032568 [Bauhinia variegata]